MMNAFILAGGRSTRLGFDKAFLDVDGKPLIQRELDLLKPSFSTVLIISNDSEKYSLLNAPVIKDEPKPCGPLGGILTALRYSDKEYNFIVACDMPFIETRLISYFLGIPKDYDVLVPLIDGCYEPLFGVYSKKCIPHIQNLIENENYSILDLYGLVRTKTVSKTEISGFMDSRQKHAGMTDVEKCRHPRDLLAGTHSGSVVMNPKTFFVNLNTVADAIKCRDKLSLADPLKKEKPANFDKAERIILDHISKTGAAARPIMDALDLVTAADIYAASDIPSFSCSKVDGFALQSPDTKNASQESPVSLALIGSAQAGHLKQLSLKSGEAVKITTGAEVPEGADSIVKSEDCLFQKQAVLIYKPCSAARNIQPQGSIKKSGDLLIPRNKRIRAVEIEVLASAAITEVSVYKRPVVAIITTGDELAEAGRVPPAGKRINSNAYLLAALCKETNAEFIINPPAPDDFAGIKKAVQNSANADIIITTGGTAHSGHDHLLKVLRELGTVHIDGIAVKPGLHFIFATVEEKPVFALPGTPTACLVLFELFIRPSIRKMLGLSKIINEKSRAVSFSSVSKPPGLRNFIGAGIKSLRGKKFVEIGKKPSFGTLAGMLDMNGLVILHESATQVSPKDEVDILTLYPEDVEELDSELSLPEQVLTRSGEIPVVSFVGKSNSGKTTLIEKVIRELCSRGYRVGSIKHDAHYFEIDLPGKDSFRHREAGARMVVISSPDKIAIISKITSERTMDELAGYFGDSVDIIITEGFKRAGKPKVEVLRSERSKTLICSPSELIAVASDIKFDINVPGFDIDDHAGLTDLIECKFLKPDQPG